MGRDGGTPVKVVRYAPHEKTQERWKIPRTILLCHLKKGGLPSQNESKSSPKNLYFLTSFGCRFLDPVHAKFSAWLTVVNGFFGVFCTNPM